MSRKTRNKNNIARSSVKQGNVLARRSKSRRSNSRRSKSKKYSSPSSPVDDNILSYLKNITSMIPKNMINGETVQCYNNGAFLLAKLLIDEEIKFREGAPISQSTRYLPGYAGHGAFGMVFSYKLGRTRYAIKIINNPNNQDVIREYNYQKNFNLISPKVYDFDFFNCDRKKYAIIIMEYLKDYKTAIEISQIIEKWPDSDIKETIKTQFHRNIKMLATTLVSHNTYIPDFQILVNNTLSDYRVVDFGLAQKLTSEQTKNIEQTIQNMSAIAR